MQHAHEQKQAEAKSQRDSGHRIGARLITTANPPRFAEVKRGLCTCVRAFGPRVALSVALATPHLHELGVESVENVAVHRVHGVGQLLRSVRHLNIQNAEADTGGESSAGLPGTGRC